MKKCNLCGKTYPDQSLNFCLDDGGTLINISDDAPETIFMDRSRTTSENNWSNSSPFNPPVSEPLSPWQPNQPVNNSYMSSSVSYQGEDKTLPTVSLVLGILSLVLGCCYGGVYMGLPAIIIGYMGMKNADKNPGQYGGKNLAIIGMILGGISFVGIILLLFLGLMGKIFN